MRKPRLTKFVLILFVDFCINHFYCFRKEGSSFIILNLIANWTRQYIKLARSLASGAKISSQPKNQNFKGKIFSKAGRKPFKHCRRIRISKYFFVQLSKRQTIAILHFQLYGRPGQLPGYSFKLPHSWKHFVNSLLCLLGLITWKWSKLNMSACSNLQPKTPEFIRKGEKVT